MEAVTYTLTVSPGVDALLTAAALAAGFSSVEDALGDHLFRECRAFAQAVADPADPTLLQLFNPSTNSTKKASQK